MTGRPIVAGVDGSQAAHHALAWAAEAATRRGFPLLIAHANDVLERPPAWSAPVVGLSPDSPEYGRELLATSVAAVTESEATCEVITILRDESPGRLLLDLSRDAAMVVLGTHGAGRVAAALLGSVSRHVAAHAHCPVVVVPETGHRSDTHTVTRIAVGISPSPSGRQAVEFAFAEAEAEARHGTVLAVRAWIDLEWMTPLVGPAGFDRVRATEETLVASILAEPRRRHPDVHVLTVLPIEPAVEALRHAAGQADLLVLGCRRADDHRLSRLGPLASRLLHTSPCPVAVVGQPATAGC